MYFSALSLGYTELDDSIFIKEFAAYNQDLSNLVTAFTRGLFDATKDPYYRPLFSDAMILNYQFGGDNIASYHVVNILLHAATVLLLYRLCGKLKINQIYSFLIALIFAVHPVLSQAVAWIPGRNDTMLAVFVLSFLLHAISYTDSEQPKNLALSGLFLLLAYFTKETAVFAAPAAFVLLVLYSGKQWNSKPLIREYIVWVGCFGVWYAARTAASIQSSGIGSVQSLTDLIHRLPVIVQYIGKVLLPFNQSVFPTQEDTVMYWGIGALMILIGAIVLRKPRNIKPLASGLAIFLLFLMPALLVPSTLNGQTFEHRLYLPVIGILLLLPYTILFDNKLSPRQLTISVVAVCCLFAGLNIRHQRNFDNPISFWTQAAETSPNSAYALMMLAARLDKSKVAESEALFRKAYRINPKEKYLNFYFGEMMQSKDSVLASEPYLLAEKEISDYVRCDFYLARVAMVKNDKDAAIEYLQRFLTRDKYNGMAHNNLLLLLLEAGKTQEAKKQVSRMRQLGMSVPQNISRQLGM